MVGFIFLFGLLLGAFYWIISPLLREDDRQNGFTPKPEEILQELKNKKNGAYATIRELEFDLSMGKLTEEDFQILKRQYTQEAFGYMKEIDKLESSQAEYLKSVVTVPEEENEQEVTVIRNHKSAKRKYIYCTSCGEESAVESLFCAACGSNLHKRRKNYFQEEN